MALTVKLPKALEKALDALKRESGVSKSHFTRVALQEWLARRKQKGDKNAA